MTGNHSKVNLDFDISSNSEFQSLHLLDESTHKKVNLDTSEVSILFAYRICHECVSIRC